MSLTLYVHPTTKRTYDYGDLLDTEHGVMWSMTGKPEDAFGYEAGKTFEDVKRRLDETPRSDLERAAVTLALGEPISRRFDMNPHGLI